MADAKTAFQYCLENGLFGVGWHLNAYQHITEWSTYEDFSSPIYDNINICRYIKNMVNEDDLFWTRDTEGQYYLAKVLSKWKYGQSQHDIDLDINIVNIF